MWRAERPANTGKLNHEPTTLPHERKYKQRINGSLLRNWQAHKAVAGVIDLVMDGESFVRMVPADGFIEELANAKEMTFQITGAAEAPLVAVMEGGRQAV